MKPILRPRTNRPLSVPILMYSSASSDVKAPLSRRRSTKQTAMQPSTFRISWQKKVIKGFKIKIRTGVQYLS